MVGLDQVIVCNSWRRNPAEGDGTFLQAIARTTKDRRDIDWGELFHVVTKDEDPYTTYAHWDTEDPVRGEGIFSSWLAPVARFWPATCLLPCGFVYRWLDPKQSIQETGISDGCLELLKLGKLLNSTGKQLLRIYLPSVHAKQGGFPATVFNTEAWPASARLANACKHLVSLHVSLSCSPSG